MISNEQQVGEKKDLCARWVSWLFLLAAALMLIYTYYRAEITFQGNRGVFYYKYYLISLAGIGYWGIVLRLREGIRANIVTVFISTLLGLYLAEGLLTFSGFGQQSRRAQLAAQAEAAAEFGVEFDQRTRLEVIKALRGQGVDAVPAIEAGQLLTLNEELMPLAGISLKTTVSGNETGQRLIYQSDRHGFNNPDSEWDADEVVWLLIGDSYAEGVSVQPGEDIAGQLRTITKESAISLGRYGNGPLMELAELIEYAEAIKPKRVLWAYYEGNDLRGDLRRRKKNPLLMQYLKDGFSQNLINRQKEIDSILKKNTVKLQVDADDYAGIETQSLFYKTRWIRLQATRLMLFNEIEEPVVNTDPLFATILTKAKARVEAWGGKLYFVYLPEWSRYNNEVTSHDRFRKKAAVIDMVKELDIRVVDIHQEVFADHRDPLALFPFRRIGHYNSDGYREVAKKIARNIMEEAEYSPDLVVPAPPHS